MGRKQAQAGSVSEWMARGCDGLQHRDLSLVTKSRGTPRRDPFRWVALGELQAHPALGPIRAEPLIRWIR